MIIKSLIAFTCLALGVVVAYWAALNSSWLYYDTYIIADPSLAEADRVLMWFQMGIAAVCLLVGVLLARSAYYDAHH